MSFRGFELECDVKSLLKTCFGGHLHNISSMASFSLLEKVNTFFFFAFYLCMDIYNHHFCKSFVTLSYISSLIAGTLLTVCVIDGLYVPSSFFQ
jgi:predicted neutral ceramidase superfamily lipid hydrolase